MPQQRNYTVEDLGTVTHVVSQYMNGKTAPPMKAVVQEVDETVDEFSRNEITEILDDESFDTDTDQYGNKILTHVTVRGTPPTHLDGFVADGGTAVHQPIGETQPIEPNVGGEDDFTDIDGVAQARADALTEAGFDNYHDLRNAQEQDVASIDGFSSTLAQKAIATASRKVDPLQHTAAKSFQRQREFENQGPIDDTVQGLKTVASDVNKPIGKCLEERYRGILKYEDIDHPFIEDESKYEDLYTRTLKTGEEDLNFLTRVIENNEYAPVLEGHAGIGKNYLLGHIFANANRPVLRINLDSSMLAKDLLGIHSIGANREVVWDPGPVPKAVQNGWCLIIDEVNIAREGVMMCLQQLAEKDGDLHVRGENSVIKRHPAFRVVFTQNPSTAEYRGTDELNSAFNDRLMPVWMPYLDEADEASLLYDLVNKDRERLTRVDCKNLVGMATRFRNQVDQNARLPRITTRDLQKVAVVADGPPTVAAATKLVVEGCLGPRDNEEAANNLVGDEML